MIAPAPKTEGTLVQKTLLYAVGVYVVRPLGMLNSIVMRRYLTPEQMGLWGGVVKVLMNLNRVAGLGVGAASRLEIPFYRGMGDHDRALAIRRAVFSLNLVTGGLYALGIAMAVLLFRERLGADRTEVLLLAAPVVFLVKFANLYRDILRADASVRAMNWEMCADAAGLLLLMLWLVPRWGLVGLCWATLGSLLLDLLVMRLGSPFRFRWNLEWAILRPLIGYGLPLLLLQFLTVAQITVDRVVVVGWLGEGAMGYYDLATLAYGALYDIANTVAIVLLTHLLEGYGRTKDLARLAETSVRPMRLLALWLPVLFGVGVFLAPPVVSALMPRFTPGLGAMRILLGAACLASISIPMKLVVATLKHQVRVAPIGLAALGLNLGLNILFIRRGAGIEGVAWATTISSACAACAYLVYAMTVTGALARVPRMLAELFLPLGYAASGVILLSAFVLPDREGWDGAIARATAFMLWAAPLLVIAQRIFPLRRLAEIRGERRGREGI